jgi:MFS family permease
MAVGVNARTAFSLLFPPILTEFGWDRGVTAGAFSFGFLVSAIVTPSVGRLMDRRGPLLVVEAGVVTMGAGLLLATLAREPWQLYLTLGALVGGGVNCLAYTGQSCTWPTGSCAGAGWRSASRFPGSESARSRSCRGCNRGSRPAAGAPDAGHSAFWCWPSWDRSTCC